MAFLMRLALADNIRPVSLPKRSDVIKTFANEKAYLTGWGLSPDGTRFLKFSMWRPKYVLLLVLDRMRSVIKSRILAHYILILALMECQVAYFDELDMKYLIKFRSSEN
jgi:hypothetical protein